MPSMASFLLLSLLLILHCSWSFGIDNSVYDRTSCGSVGSYSQNSTYHQNLKQLISNLINAASNSNGYAYDSYGIIPDRVTGLVICRGDTVKENCSSCLQSYPMSNLPDQAYTGGYRDNELGEFKDVISALFTTLADFAAYKTTTKYATGIIKNYYDFPQMIFGLVQCSPYQSDDDCWKCLKNSTDSMVNNLTEIYFGRVFGLWCDLRYDSAQFYDGQPLLELSFPLKTPPPPIGDPSPYTGLYSPPLPVHGDPSPSSGSKNKGKISVKGIILKIVEPIVAIILTSVFCICIRKRRSANAQPPANDFISLDKATTQKTHLDEQNKIDAGNPIEIKSVESLLFDWSVIRTATDDFAEGNKLGQGGFGCVYKGVLHDGREIAVKRLSETSTQGIGELKNELVLLANLHHINLVRLFGACLGEEEKLLVYEYVPNRSLDKILFDTERRKQLDWSKRFKIIGGIAKGMQYLHEDSQLKIIHRDLKVSNILVDAKMNPKISDFGLARLSMIDQTKEITRRVVGTLGYMSPEYAMLGYFSTKSDVFSFGIIILEIITGKRINSIFESEETQTLLSYVWEHWRRERVNEIIDRAMGDEYRMSEVINCIHIGLLCCQENPVDRPTMSTVVVKLETTNASFLQAPSRPSRPINANLSDLV